jgi:tripartite-type tricarboxylate transporter receptor subunit TctC
MQLGRRRFLQLMMSATSLAFSNTGWAQVFPARPVRIIVGFPPGGSADITARLLGQWLTERLGQRFVVETRPGAATNIATEAVARAPADGYTLLLVTQANAVNATLYDKLNFDFIRDIAPVASILRVPGMMVVDSSFPARTVPEFISYAKANPGKINMGSGGNGSAQHLYGELFKVMTGIEMVHVPYSGQVLTGLLGRQVQVVFNPVPSTLDFIRAGKLRALAVTTAIRLEALPDVPTIAESVPSYEASGWFGIGAPKGTPAEIVGKLNHEINAALADPKLRARIADLGGSVLTGSPGEFGKLIAAETQKWGKVVKTASIKLD